MTERKWTPGPWVVIDQDQVWADDIVCTVCNNETADLIAAAPDLYEALSACLNFIANTENEMGETLMCGDKARAALAKARGE